MRIDTTSACGVTWNGSRGSSSLTSSYPRPINRLTEYTVRAALPANCRPAAPPPTTPSRVHATTEGRRARPSASGITRGMPPSTWATRLLVVPRSMPTMRDMVLLALSQRVTQVVDHGAQVGPGGEPLLEPLEEGLAVAAPVHEPVPLGKARDHRLRLRCVARLQPAALLAQPRGRVASEPFGLRLLQRLLHFQHLLQQLPWSLGLLRGPLACLPSFLECDQVLDPRERIAQGPVGAIDQRRLRERVGLARRVRGLVKVGVMLARQ